MLDPPFELKVDHQLVFSTKVLNQELHEDVEDIRLIDISDRVERQSLLRDHNREPRAYRINLQKGE